MTEDFIEERLSTTLKALASQIFPDEESFSVPSRVSDEEPGCGTLIRSSGHGTPRPKPSSQRKWRPPTRRIGAVVLGLGLVGIGTGIAAAAGAFGPVHPPRLTAGTAMDLINPVDNYTAPGQVTRYQGSGPDGASFTVVSASSHPNSGCIKIVITAAPKTKTRSIPGGCTKQGNVNAPTPTTSVPSTSTYGMDNFPWRSSSGTTYTIWYGQGPLGTVSVHLERNIARGPVPRYQTLGTNVGANKRWFAIAIPPGDSIAFYDAAGHVIDRAATGARPGGPRMCIAKTTPTKLIPC